MGALTVPLLPILTELPATGAVFTSFTLSLTWFESTMLRPMERLGVEDVLVLADPIGVGDSLHEGLATGPGVRYALEAISQPNGAFHPKLAFVWAPNALVLAVGSGNLSFAGMNRNLEVWDVLVAGVDDAAAAHQLDQAVARGLVDLLAHLAARLDRTGHGRTVLERAGNELERWMPRLPGRGPARWLTSIERPIGAQLAELLPPTPGRRVEVLSPFFDAGGAGVARLGDALAAPVDLLYHGETIAFPLAQAREAGRPYTTRQLDGPDPTRPLHAKVFRVVEPDREHLLTGSANASFQALWTTNNIEVCLLREGEAGRWDALCGSQPGTPREVPTPAPESTVAVLSIVRARATAGGLAVRLVWRGPTPPTELQVSLVDADDHQRLPWTEQLLLPLPASFDPLRPVACRLQVVVDHQGRHEARAWISFDELLGAPAGHRAAQAAWSRRMLDPDAAPDENDARLLQIFTEEHARVLGQFVRRRTGRGAEPGRTPEPAHEPVPLRLLDALARRENLFAPGSSASVVERATAAMTAAFRTIVPGGGGPSSLHAAAPQRTTRLPPAVREALLRFQDRFLAEAISLVRPPENPAAVLGYTALCARMAVHYWLQDGGDRAGMWTAVNRVVTALLCPRPGLDQGPALNHLRPEDAALSASAAETLHTCVALLAWKAQDGRIDAEDTVDARTLLHGIALRDALATLEGTPRAELPPPAVPRELENALSRQGLLDALAPLRAPDVAGGELRGLLRLMVDASTPGFRVPQDLPTDRRRMVLDARGGAPVARVDPWISACPLCRTVLALRLAADLAARRPVRCLQSRCAAWLLPVGRV